MSIFGDELRLPHIGDGRILYDPTKPPPIWTDTLSLDLMLRDTARMQFSFNHQWTDTAAFLESKGIVDVDQWHYGAGGYHYPSLQIMLDSINFGTNFVQPSDGSSSFPGQVIYLWDGKAAARLPNGASQLVDYGQYQTLGGMPIMFPDWGVDIQQNSGQGPWTSEAAYGRAVIPKMYIPLTYRIKQRAYRNGFPTTKYNPSIGSIIVNSYLRPDLAFVLVKDSNLTAFQKKILYRTDDLTSTPYPAFSYTNETFPPSKRQSISQLSWTNSGFFLNIAELTSEVPIGLWHLIILGRGSALTLTHRNKFFGYTSNYTYFFFPRIKQEFDYTSAQFYLELEDV